MLRAAPGSSRMQLVSGLELGRILLRRVRLTIFQTQLPIHLLLVSCRVRSTGVKKLLHLVLLRGRQFHRLVHRLFIIFLLYSDFLASTARLVILVLLGAGAPCSAH